MDSFEGAGFSVLDVENIRLHYAKTLDWWHRLYEESSEHVAQMFDDNFVRMWRLYLLGSRAAFITGEMQLFQVVFAPGNSNNIPWTRSHVYAP
jgi:cyclopropane-fatty-acyl-phospholipid synthase